MKNSEQGAKGLHLPIQREEKENKAEIGVVGRKGVRRDKKQVRGECWAKMKESNGNNTRRGKEDGYRVRKAKRKNVARYQRGHRRKSLKKVKEVAEEKRIVDKERHRKDREIRVLRKWKNIKGTNKVKLNGQRQEKIPLNASEEGYINEVMRNWKAKDERPNSDSRVGPWERRKRMRKKGQDNCTGAEQKNRGRMSCERENGGREAGGEKGVCEREGRNKKGAGGGGEKGGNGQWGGGKSNESGRGRRGGEGGNEDSERGRGGGGGNGQTGGGKRGDGNKREKRKGEWEGHESTGGRENRKHRKRKVSILECYVHTLSYSSNIYIAVTGYI